MAARKQLPRIHLRGLHTNGSRHEISNQIRSKSAQETYQEADFDAESAAARAKSRASDLAAEGRKVGDSIWGEKSKAWREDLTNRRESRRRNSSHSAKANPTPETIKKKPSTCGGGGELDASPSIPIETQNRNTE